MAPSTASVTGRALQSRRPVHVRDMILRMKLGPQEAQVMNQEFQEYLTRFGDIQRVARGILEKLAAGQRKSA